MRISRDRRTGSFSLILGWKQASGHYFFYLLSLSLSFIIINLIGKLLALVEKLWVWLKSLYRGFESPPLSLLVPRDQIHLHFESSALVVAGKLVPVGLWADDVLLLSFAGTSHLDSLPALRLVATIARVASQVTPKKSIINDVAMWGHSNVVITKIFNAFSTDSHYIPLCTTLFSLNVLSNKFLLVLILEGSYFRNQNPAYLCPHSINFGHWSLQHANSRLASSLAASHSPHLA